MSLSTCPVDWMLSNGIMTWFIIGTLRINDKLEDGTVAMLTGIMCCGMPKIITTPQYFCAMCFYKRLNWKQQPKSQIVKQKPLEKTALGRGRTDRISLTNDLDLQSPASYSHDLLKCKSSRSMVSLCEDRVEKSRRTDGWMEDWR